MGTLKKKPKVNSASPTLINNAFSAYIEGPEFVKTREKLKNHVLAYFVNDGKSIPKVRDNSQDLVFSFDSFVHMHSNVTEEYVKEIFRVLCRRGWL